MEERRSAERLRTNLQVRWQTLRTEGRGSVCDLSVSGCFVLTGGEVSPRELVRMDLLLPQEVVTLWGNVVYSLSEMGFAVRFLFSGKDQETFEASFRALEEKVRELTEV